MLHPKIISHKRNAALYVKSYDMVSWVREKNLPSPFEFLIPFSKIAPVATLNNSRPFSTYTVSKISYPYITFNSILDTLYICYIKTRYTDKNV